MAEDEEMATARYIASNVSTQLMLKTMFEIIATMVDDPDRYRLGYNGTVARDGGYHAIGPDGRGARKEGPCFRQGTVGNLLDQPSA